MGSRISAKVIEDSISPDGVRLTTLQLKYPRFIHAEAKTHRVISNNGEEYEQIILTQDEGFMSDRNLSRNASSSRAIPVAKMIEQVRSDPAMPIYWGSNQPGMQAGAELTGEDLEYSKGYWQVAARYAADFAEKMDQCGVHKQIANRILEPFQWISVVVTATEWENFFALRNHAAAQPEIRELAIQMQAAMEASTPTLLEPGEWHLPYVTDAERTSFEDSLVWRKISAARCARVSYLLHDGQTPDCDKDLALYDRLITMKPMHASPVEHQATPDTVSYHDRAGGITFTSPELHGNFKGWCQFRKILELQLEV